MTDPPRADAGTPDPSAALTRKAAPRPEFVRRVEAFEPQPQPRPRADPPHAGSEFDADELRRVLARAVEHGHLASTTTGSSVMSDGADPAYSRDPR